MKIAKEKNRKRKGASFILNQETVPPKTSGTGMEQITHQQATNHRPQKNKPLKNAYYFKEAPSSRDMWMI